jgi:ferritin heavy chain
VTVWFLFQGAYFSRDTINRPGFAKLFFEASSEKREHAIKIISYLLMRGELTSDLRKLIQNPVSNKSSQ